MDKAIAIAIANSQPLTWREVNECIADVHDQLRNLQGLCNVLGTFEWADPEPLEWEDIGRTAHLMSRQLDESIKQISLIEESTSSNGGTELRSQIKSLKAVKDGPADSEDE